MFSKFRFVMLLALLTLGAACSSTMSSGAVPPSTCDVPEGLAAVWRDYRLSQIGPAWITLTLRCDCRYSMTSQLLFMRLKEEGVFEASDDRITFTRAETSPTVWPYRLENGALTLVEYEHEDEREEHEYSRSKSYECK